MPSVSPIQNQIQEKNGEIFALADEARSIYLAFLKDFNAKKIKLTAVPAHKRIFLFFMTRIIKTFSAVLALCKEGYGQDASPLLRTLLEILISIRYIVCNPEEADQKAVRFVDYKWVIFRKHLLESKIAPAGDSAEDLLSHSAMITEKFQAFKKKYNVTSDKALVTWSGKSTRDMAKLADKKLLKEYESAFRLDSRFSHPSIIGDKEYLDYQGSDLVFSFQPSDSGIAGSLKRAMGYLTLALTLFDSLFDLNGTSRLGCFRSRTEEIFKMEKYRKALFVEKSSPSLNKGNAANISVQFNVS